MHVLTLIYYRPHVAKLGSILNFGNETTKIEFDDQVMPLPPDERAGRCEIDCMQCSTNTRFASVVTVTSNLHVEGNYWPRKEIDLNEEFKLGPHQGVVIRFK